MSDTGKEISEAIQQLADPWDNNRVLDIMVKINNRIDEVEARFSKMDAQLPKAKIAYLNLGCDTVKREPSFTEKIDSLFKQQTELRWQAQSNFYRLGRGAAVNATLTLLLRGRETGRKTTTEEIYSLTDSLAGYKP